MLTASNCGFGSFKKGKRTIAPYSVGKLLFGLSGEQQDCIFQPGKSPFNKSLNENARPDEVAANIREFVRVRYG